MRNSGINYSSGKVIDLRNSGEIAKDKADHEELLKAIELMKNDKAKHPERYEYDTYISYKAEIEDSLEQEY